MKRTNFDASSYTRFLRERANTRMYQTDLTSRIPQTERKSIVSNSPAADLLKNGFLNEFYTPPPASASAPTTVITIISEVSYISPGSEGSFQYTLRTNTPDTITVYLYDNGDTDSPVNGTNVGTTTPIYNITPLDDIIGEILVAEFNAISGHYYYIRIVPGNGPEVISTLFIC
jgi:hypothetical protein